MKILNISSSTKVTYEVEMKYSILWECALGIAAATYDELHHTLERSEEYWNTTIGKLTSEIKEELMYSKKNNTWKTLLQLLCIKDFKNLDHFTDYIEDLKEEELRFYSIPFLGLINEENRKRASRGDELAKLSLIEISSDNKFFPSYIEFIYGVNFYELKKHLVKLMRAWYEVVIKPDQEYILSILKRDIESKDGMLKSLSPEKFVEWATGGRAYLPEPTISRVLLIPQYIYRPWIVEADDINTKIFFYPVSDESIHSVKDAYVPDLSLIQSYKALGDEARLRIVKLLYEGDKTLQELTDKLNLAKSTIHHHLSMLRGAKLVKVEEAKYHLNKEFLFMIESELKSYLER